MSLRFLVPVVALALFAFAQRPKNQKIVFFGDSITQQGAQRGGYILLLDSILRSKGDTGKELIGAGIGGNKIYDLYLRLEDDVLAKNPDIVVIWVGVNDVWHKRMFGTGTDPDKFERFYDAIIRKLQARNIKTILCTPAVIGEKKGMANELDGDLNKYSAIIRNIAAKNHCPIVDFRSVFTDYINKNNPQDADRGVLTTDGVHLNPKGNLMVAETFAKMTP